jgi:hypothetical protein
LKTKVTMVESTCILETKAKTQAQKQIEELQADRIQAITLLKEIYGQISGLSPQTVDLIETKSKNPLSSNYGVQLKGLDSDSIEQIINLLKQHGLTANVKEDQLTFL